MKKLSFILLLLGAALAFSSCSDELSKNDADYAQNPSIVATKVTLDSLKQASEEEVAFKATITPSAEDIVYDQGILISTTEDFAVYQAVSVVPDTVDAVITMENAAYAVEQGLTLYFKAFVLTKEGMAVSTEVKSINLPVTWETVGKVLYTDPFWSGKEGEIVIQKFNGRNEYRLVDLFHILDDDAAAVPAGKHLRFFLDDDGNADYISNGHQDVFTAPLTFLYDDDTYPQYCFFTNKANVYEIGFIGAVSGSPYYTATGTFEWIDGYPGEIPKPVNTVYKTDFSDAEAQKGWVLDAYSGYGATDLVWWDTVPADMDYFGGVSVAMYNDGSKNLRAISPSVEVGPADTLTFSYFAGAMEASPQTKVKVYIRDLSAELGTPVKEWNVTGAEDGVAVIPLAGYEGKTIRVMIVCEEGDFVFNKFAIAETSDPDLLF